MFTGLAALLLAGAAPSALAQEPVAPGEAIPSAIPQGPVAAGESISMRDAIAVAMQSNP